MTENIENIAKYESISSIKNEIKFWEKRKNWREASVERWLNFINKCQKKLKENYFTGYSIEDAIQGIIKKKENEIKKLQSDIEEYDKKIALYQSALSLKEKA